MAKARKASKTKSKLMMILYGEPFTGKSTLALQLAYFKREDGKPFRILYLDPESGSVDDYLPALEDSVVNLDNIYIVYTQSLGEVREYIAKVKNNEDFYELDDEGEETDEIVMDADGEPFRADAIVVDGATILNLTTKQGLVEFSKRRNRVKADKENLLGEARLVKIEGAGLELKDYQTINFKGQDLILDLMASGVHCIFTAREEDEKVNKEIEGKRESVITGRKIPSGFKGMDYNARTVIRTYMDEETDMVCAHVIKDRTGVHKKNEIIEDPTLLDYQAVIDKTAGYNNFVLKNDLTKSVDVEQKIYEKEILNKVGEPVKDMKASNTDTNSEEDIDKIKSDIKSIISKLTAVEKTEFKNKLKEANLPVNFMKVQNVKTLKNIFSVLS